MSLSPIPARREAAPRVGPDAATGRQRRGRALAALALSGLMMSGLAMAGGLATIPSQAALADAPASFADLAERVSPAVVNISTTREVDQPSGSDLPFSFPPGSPFEEFFRQFRDRMGPGQGQGQGQGQALPREARALGSGFIIDPEGFVVTNNHVIDGADQIQVTLTDGTTLPAKLIGRDPQTDLALVKVESDRPLPAVAFGDSDAVRVGDWVVAVGNPFGLGGTVSAGIISARSRDIHAGPFDDFLQIDAAINPGNSGGPTFDLDGNVIGVNTAIASPNGGNVGIGFAIPANMAKPIIAQLKEKGSVERGWLGVQIQEVTPDLAQALGLDAPKGALVSRVMPDGPAAAAGIRQGDVILSFDDKPVDTMRDLPRIVAETPAGTEVEIEVWRDRATRSLSADIARQQQDDVVASTDAPSDPAAESGTAVPALGATVADLSPALKQRFALPEEATGVVIVELDSNGPAAEEGLLPGDVIEKVAQKEVSSAGEVAELAKQAEEADQSSLLLLVNRQGDALFVAVKLAKA